MSGDDDRVIDPEQPLSLDDALLLGTRLHRLAQLDQAHAVYSAVLKAAPEHPMALQFLGILEHQRRNSELAMNYMRRALAQSPDAPGLHQNLGNMLLEMQRWGEAASAYERCAQLGGQSAELLTNIGVLHGCQARHEAAEAAFRAALALDPSYSNAYHGYGRVLWQQGRHAEALAQHSEAFARNPEHGESRHQLAQTLCMLGRWEKAAQVYRDWLAAEPDNPRPRYYLAACTGDAVPDRAPDAYVAATFDGFARSFDSQLNRLQYCGPELIDRAVRALLGEPRADRDVLDAGCGTGLCAPFLTPFARHLTGVDLSGGMLAKARTRSAYQALHQAELTEFMRARPNAFDLIVAADTFCYFGALEDVCRAAFEALRPAGNLVCTIEALPATAARSDASFKLGASGRYAHDAGYVRRTLAAAAFESVALEEVVLRTQETLPVRAYLVTARRA